MKEKHTVSWREAIQVYRQRTVVVMFFLGFSAGLPFLLVFSTLTAWLTEEGLSKSAIGFFSWIGITYSVKVFWAPVVDRFQLPLLQKLLGQRRSWILLAQSGIVAGLMLMAVTDPVMQLTQLAVLGVLVAFSSATQDISIDAYRIEAAVPEFQAAMSATYVFGYRLALLVAGAGSLYIAEYWSWSVTYLVMGGFAALGMLTTLIAPKPEIIRPSLAPALIAAINSRLESLTHLPDRLAKTLAWLLEAVVGPFADFCKRHGWTALGILALVSVYRISDITMGVMANPFYLDMGFTKVQIADVTKVFGFLMTIVGSILGGVLVTKFGIPRILLLGAILVAATNLLFAWMAAGPAELLVLALVVSADNLSGGLAVVAFIAYLSSLTSTDYTATQYALFSSLMTLPGKFIGGFSGIVVDSHGYTLFFLAASVLGIPAILLALWWLTREKSVSKENNRSEERELTG